MALPTCVKTARYMVNGAAPFPNMRCYPKKWFAPLNAKLSLEEGAVLENLGIAVHAVESRHHDPGDWAVVIGAGPIGILASQALLAGGVNTVITDMVDYRLEVADQIGCGMVIDIRKEDPVKKCLS